MFHYLRKGGFFHFYAEDGSVFDKTTRVLVTEARFVFSFAEAYLQLGDDKNPHLDNLSYLIHGYTFPGS